MEDLPEDVLTNILSWLPVTSLLQFRSISKSWQSIIDSHHFKTLHLNNSHKFNSKLILQTQRLPSQLYAVNLPIPHNPVSLNQPLNSYGKQITILGSCNGLLCIKNVKDDIIIWNPSLRKRWILPYVSTSCPFEPNISLCGVRIRFTSYGFGFDSIMGDYKLVKISSSLGARINFKFKVDLFSCRTNVWKTLTTPPDYSLWSLECVFVDHALHWVVGMTGTKLIVAFDLRFEVFNEVPLPELGNNSELQVSHLGGCLSMLVSYSQITSLGFYAQITSIDFWVMKQYGYKDTWFKLFTLTESPELIDLQFLKPLGYYCQDMKVVFNNDHELFCYNLKSKQVTHVTNPKMFLFEATLFWVESLVQPTFHSSRIWNA